MLLIYVNLSFLLSDGPYNLEVNCEQGLRTGEVFTVNQGEMVFFDCLADSYPPNTCVWISSRNNGTEVLMTGPRFEVASHTLGHATNFLCRAFNNITNKQDETHFTLVVANLGNYGFIYIFIGIFITVFCIIITLYGGILFPSHV